MSDFRKLTEGFYASPQISVEDIADAAAMGVTLVVNNRPDGEAPDQPEGSEIEAAARAAGMDYVAIPVSGAGFSQPQIESLRKAIADTSGTVLGFCRSGTRSTLLWSLYRASEGDNPDEIAAAANAAGYDIAPIRPAVEALAAEARA
ncbi:MAG: TIGR01244 family sulfur transferase [Erythrobacter sp.]